MAGTRKALDESDREDPKESHEKASPAAVVDEDDRSPANWLEIDHYSDLPHFTLLDSLATRRAEPGTTDASIAPSSEVPARDEPVDEPASTAQAALQAEADARGVRWQLAGTGESGHTFRINLPRGSRAEPSGEQGPTEDGEEPA